MPDIPASLPSCVLADMYEPGGSTGLLADFEPMTNYRLKHQWGTFSAEDACNFAMNIYNDGDVLSIGAQTISNSSEMMPSFETCHPHLTQWWMLGLMVPTSRGSPRATIQRTLR